MDADPFCIFTYMFFSPAAVTAVSAGKMAFSSDPFTDPEVFYSGSIFSIYPIYS